MVPDCPFLDIRYVSVSRTDFCAVPCHWERLVAGSPKYRVERHKAIRACHLLVWFPIVFAGSKLSIDSTSGASVFVNGSWPAHAR